MDTMSTADVCRQRSVRIAVLNLMPIKVDTETDLVRVFSDTPYTVRLDWMKVESHVSKHTPQAHMDAFYRPFSAMATEHYDGFIITGAPLEQMEFEEVTYWPELQRIFDWAHTHVASTLYICWAAQAGLYYHYGIQKRSLPEKLFGVYRHHADYKRAILLRGFDDTFWAPHSRHTTIDRADVEAVPGLKILASSEEAGVYIIMNKEGRQIFVTGHSEYDPDTLEREYLRDRNQGLPIRVPVNYYPHDDDTQIPIVRWRGHGNLLYSNWLNYFVYQTTPYDIMAVGEESTEE